MIRLKKRQSFQSHLPALLLISTVLPTVILSAVLACYLQNRIYEDNDKYFSTSLYSVSTHLSTYVYDLKRLTLTPYICDDILNLYTVVDNGNHTRDGSRDYTIEYYRQNYTTTLQRILITAREDILVVSFVPANPDNHIMVTTTKNSDFIDNTEYAYESEAWYQNNLNHDQPCDFIVSDSPVYLGSGRTIISAMHTVRNVYTKRKLGVIRIDASDEIIKDIFKDVTLSENSGFVIVNQDGNLIYQVGKVEEDVTCEFPLAGQTIRTGSGTYDLYKSKISGMSWQLVFVSPRRNTTREVSIIWSLTTTLSLASIITAYLIFRSNSRRTSLALNSILEVMQEVAKGDSNTSVPDTALLGNDSFNTEESSLIAENLSEMIQKPQFYIDRSYKYEISRQEAEHRVLQSQINPHFLYNMLNCFTSMNRLGMRKELEDSIIRLTRIFRYTCNNAKLTTVKGELVFCTQYCQLLKMRYDEHLTFYCQVEEKAAGISIPRLLIQPLVENAIKHGTDTEGISIITWITAFVRDRALILEERNNDVPIQVDAVYAEGKVGIRNVENRIKMIHPQVVFEIGLEDRITSVIIKIPLGEDMEHEDHIG